MSNYLFLRSPQTTVERWKNHFLQLQSSQQSQQRARTRFGEDLIPFLQQQMDVLYGHITDGEKQELLAWVLAYDSSLVEAQ